MTVKKKGIRMHGVRTQLRKAAHRGVTLIELGVVIALIAIFAGFATTMYQGSSETRDAKMVQAAQAKLQAIVSQASVRLDLSPTQLTQGTNAQNVLNALRVAVNQDAGGSTHNGVSFQLSGNNFQLSIPSSGRGAQYQVTGTGDVQLVSGSLVNFTNYGVQNGVIHKL